MPLYFFDIVDGGAHRDDEGTQCADDEAVRRMVRETLPEIAKDEIPADGDRRHFTIVVRDENETPVYTATLSYVGMWLNKRP